MKPTTRANQSTGFGFGGLSTSSTTLSYIAPPPNLSNVPVDIIVPFKNLLKKDSITKQKALEDIVSYVKTHPIDNGGIQDSVLDAWCQLYARISIDNSRRVRELSHIVLLELLKSTKKRMESRLSPLVGAWLAGAFDRDKAVSRAATDGFSLLADTEEKNTKVWNKAQSRIMDYATEAIRETSDTLSDQRSTTKEDAEAKYHRVVASSLALVLNLMKRTTDLGKLQDRLSEYLASETVWSLAASEDSFVRRSLYQLLQACLDVNPELLKPQLLKIGRVLMQQCLRGNQSNSCIELVKVLTSLTKVFPEIWGTRKHSLELVKPFVEKGSQGSSWAYWVELKGLLLDLPGPAPSPDLAASFLQSMRKGISSRGEPMASIPHAWSCYLSVFEKVIAGFTPDPAFLQANIFPLTQHFLYPTPELSEWNSVTGTQFIPKAWDIVNSHPDGDVRKSAHDEWQKLSDMFVSKLKISLPEVSKDHQNSQNKIAATGDRWYTLAAALLRHLRRAGGQSGGQLEGDSGEHLTDTIASSSVKIIEAGRELLMRRNFKPFGAASVLQSAFKKCPVLAGDGSLIASLFPIDNSEKVQTLVGSPSLVYLVPCLDQLAGIQRGRFESIWNELVEAACATQDVAVSQNAVNLLISIPSAITPSRRQQHLQGYLISAMADCARGNKSSSWDLFESAASSALDEPTLKSLVETILGIMGEAGDRTAVLKAINILAHKSTAGSLLTHDQHLRMQLVTNLLAMTELSGQPESGRIVRELLDFQPSPAGDEVLKEIIQKSLDDAGPASLKIETLLQEAEHALSSGAVPMEELLPNTNVWIQELRCFLEAVPDPSLSLTSRLGGAYFLVEKDASAREVRSTPKRDRRGRSIPARMAIFTSKILSGDRLSSLPKDLQVEILYLLSLTTELADDQLTSLAAGGLWDNAGQEEAMAEIQELSTQSRRIIISVARLMSEPEDWKEADLDGDGLIPRLTAVMIAQMRSFSSLGLYSAKALSNLFETLVEIQGPPSGPRLEAWLEQLAKKVTPGTTFPVIAFITGFQEKLAESKSISGCCTRLISEMSGDMKMGERTLWSLVLLNACMSVYENGKLPVGNHRQVLALKQLSHWLMTSDNTNPGLDAELFKAVHQIFPNVKHVYGPYWEKVINCCIDFWGRAAEYPPNESLACMQASIKLMLALETEAKDANDDLVDALAKNSAVKSTMLIGLLKLPRANTQVSFNVDSLLSRCIEKVPLGDVLDLINLSDLYGLVASESRAIQSAAFGLLHRALPAAQENIALDAVLDKTQARLPDELLSLFLDAPTLESFHDVLGEFPAPIRSYLLGWHLVFDAYSTAPQKLRDDYTECIKSQNILHSLLDFTFDVLGHSAANPLNLDKEGLTQNLIKRYNVKVAESEQEEKNMHWLLVHLCYMTLKYLPGLFRTWYLNCESKQTKNAVKAWTTKYLSSMLISESLDDVDEWHSRQGKEKPQDDEKELNVKISRAAREVTAEYEIDEEFCSILIRIPVEYPLEMVEVVGLNRVAVDENKWKHWILTTQGVITFANGSITDGLSAFRRNVVGLLKGHTECAICYSIVATDKKLPDKECKTCHNMFHRLCLYKWFQNSGRNTCPLCRMPIEYLGSSDRAKRAG